MKKYLLLPLVMCFTLGGWAQEEENLDDIFDDGMNKSVLAVGTDIVTDITGTINVHVNFKPVSALRLQAGVGFMPLGIYFDLMNILRSDELPIVDTSLTKGFYYSLGAHFVKETGFSGFSYYYYFDYKHWGYNALESQLSVKKFKANFGMGYIFDLPYNLSLDLNVGVFLGRDRVTATELFDDNMEVQYHGRYFSEPGEIGSMMFNGFDFGLGLNYNF